MEKIPVGKTIAYTYAFTFGHFSRLFGLIWVPVAVAQAISYFASRFLIAAQQSSGATGPAALLANAPLMLVSAAVVLVCLSMSGVAVTREALGLVSARGPVYFNVPLEAPVWRLMGAYLSALGAMVGLYLVVLIVLVVAGVLLGAILAVVAPVAFSSGADAEQNRLGVGFALGGGGAALAFLYGGARLWFLIAPVTVMGGRIALRRGWALSKGNGWRIVAILLAIVVPLLLIQFVFSAALLGRDILPPFGGGTTPQDVAASQAAMRLWQARMSDQSAKLWYILQPFGLLFGVLSYAAGNTASAFAYRALVPVDLETASVFA